MACLDVRGGRVVKGVRFADLRDQGDPAELARRYAEQGIDALVVLDVSATLEERGAALETVRAVRAVLDVPLCVGGGVDGLERARALVEAGADQVAVNSAAVARPALIGELARAFGSQSTVVAIDAARAAHGFEVRVRSGTGASGRDAVEWAREAVALGAGEVLLTSWDRDGTALGYDLELLAAVAGAVRVPVVASGGAATATHLRQALEAGASAVLVASMLHSGATDVGRIKRELAREGVEVRR